MTEEHFVVEERTKSIVIEEEEKKGENEEDEQKLESEGWAVFKADGVEFKLNLKQRLENERKDKNADHDAEKQDDDDAERYFIGESGPLKGLWWECKALNNLYLFLFAQF